MTESSHTPGPWNVLEFKESLHITGGPRKRGLSLARIVLDDDEDKANARLIAAAPELLEASKNFLLDNERESGHFESAELLRKAIAKAEGRIECM